MIEKLRQSSENVVGYKATGTITRDDVEKVRPDLEQLANNGKLCMLLELNDFKGETVGALTDDLEFGVKYGKDVEKLAIVGDKEWEKKVTRTAEKEGINTRYFHTSQIDAAWKWLEK